MAASAIPNHLRYSAQHEWLLGLASGTVRVGITDHAQQALGDVVYVSLPAVGATVTAGDPMGEVESTKSVADVFAPVTGIVVARNEALGTSPDLVNTDPYGDGWIAEIRPDSEGAGLLDATGYAALLADDER